MHTVRSAARPRTARALAVSAVIAGAALSALAIAACPAHAQTATARPGCIEVEVQNVRAEQGAILVAAYDDAAAFGKSPAASLQMRTGAAPTLRFPLCGLVGSTVALTLFQDLNGNGHLDRNAFGVPTEPWGASGRTAAMSAPTWDTTAVPIDGAVIIVKLSK